MSVCCSLPQTKQFAIFLKNLPMKSFCGGSRLFFFFNTNAKICLNFIFPYELNFWYVICKSVQSIWLWSQLAEPPKYRTRAIISRGLYFFNPFFTGAYIGEWPILQSGLNCRAAYVSWFFSIHLTFVFFVQVAKGEKKRGKKIDSFKINSTKPHFTSVCDRALQVNSSLVKGFTSLSM